MLQVEITSFDKLQEQEIKKIVESNINITNDNLYDKLVTWKASIYWYSVESGCPARDGTTYYPRMNPIGNRKSIKEWKSEIESIAAKYRTVDKQCKSFVDNWNPNPYKFAKAVSKLFFNITNNEEALENVRKHFANIQYNIRK